MDYYQLLGVHRSASAVEIRTAYRKLVQQLHPDINPDPAALERIQQINEAYDVIGDETKRRTYDYQLDNPYTTVTVEPEPSHRDPAYRRRGPRPPAQSSAYSPRELMAQYIKYFRWMCAVCLGYASLVGADFAVPRSESTETIKGFYRVYNMARYGRRSYSHDVMVMASGKEVLLYEYAIKVFEGDDTAVLTYTPVLKHVMSVSVPGTGEAVATGQMYITLWFVPALLFICSGLGLFLRGVEMPFNFGIISVVLFFITLYLY